MAVEAVVTKLMFFNVTPFVLLVPMVSGAAALEMTTWFWDQSAAGVAVAPTRVTVAVPYIVTASV